MRIMTNPSRGRGGLVNGNGNGRAWSNSNAQVNGLKTQSQPAVVKEAEVSSKEIPTSSTQPSDATSEQKSSVSPTQPHSPTRTSLHT